jgi:hypothetical protein
LVPAETGVSGRLSRNDCVRAFIIVRLKLSDAMTPDLTFSTGNECLMRE